MFLIMRKMTRISHQGGAILVFSLLVLVPMILALVLYINTSWGRAVKYGLRVACDQAALAAASVLPADPSATLVSYVASAQVMGSSLSLKDHQIGIYSGGTLVPGPYASANAVSVTLGFPSPRSYFVNISPWSAVDFKCKAIAQAEVDGGGVPVGRAYLVE